MFPNVFIWLISPKEKIIIKKKQWGKRYERSNVDKAIPPPCKGAQWSKSKRQTGNPLVNWNEQIIEMSQHGLWIDQPHPFALGQDLKIPPEWEHKGSSFSLKIKYSYFLCTNLKFMVHNLPFMVLWLPSLSANTL